jgi:fibronectin-binding protein 1
MVVYGANGGQNVTVAYTNSKEEETTTSLTLQKLVSGNGGDKDKAFTFDIYMNRTGGGTTTYLSGKYTVESSIIKDSGATTAPEYTEITFTNGKATVSLKHGQQIVIKGLPKENYTYAVRETNADGYVVTWEATNGYDGTITYGTNSVTGKTDSKDVTVKFTNTKNQTIPTGVNITFLPYLALGVLSACALLYLILPIRRKKSK